MQNKILNFIALTKKACFIGCLFVCPLLFLTNTTQNPFAVQPLLLSIFGSILILCYTGEVAFKKEINFRYSKLDFIFIAFLFSLLLSLAINYFFGANKTALINEFLRKSDYLILGLLFGFLFAKITSVKFEDSALSYKFFKYIFIWCSAWLLWKIQAGIFVAILMFAAGVYLCFTHLKKYNIKEVLDIMFAACFCSCLYGIMQALGLELFWVLDISKEFGARPVSTFGNPNFLSSFVLLFLPYSLLLFVWAKNKQENLISGFIVLVLSLFLVISGTRSSWIGLLFCCLISFVLLRKIFVSKFLKILILFLVFCVCTFGLVSALKRNDTSIPGARISEVKQALSLQTFSLQSKNLIQPLHQRLMMWHCALDNFKNSPIVGKGINSFQLNFPYCQGKLIAKNPALDKMKMQANAAHNEYLEILSDGGLISFAIYVVLLVLFFVMFSKNIRTHNEQEKYFYFVLLLGLIGVLIDNLFNITLRILLVSFAFWFIFSTINNLNATNKKISLHKWVGILIFVLTCMVICALVNLQAKYFKAQTYELNGYKNLVKGNYKTVVTDMEKAMELSSLKPEPYYVLLNTYIDLNNYGKAQEIVEKALKLYPAYYEFNYRLAALKHTQNRQPEALESLRKTLSLLPTYTPAAGLFAGILVNQNYVSKEDKRLIENLIEILPYEPNLPSYLAEIYFKENDCPKAVEFASKALKGNIFDKPAQEIINACSKVAAPDTSMEFVKKINELKNKLKFEQSEALFKEISELYQKYPAEYELVALMAEFHFKQGNFCEARDIMKRAKGNNFWGKSYNLSLSLSAQQCGDKETSRLMLEEILYLDPYDEFAKNRLKNVNI